MQNPLISRLNSVISFFKLTQFVTEPTQVCDFMHFNWSYFCFYSCSGKILSHNSALSKFGPFWSAVEYLYYVPQEVDQYSPKSCLEVLSCRFWVTLIYLLGLDDDDDDDVDSSWTRWKTCLLHIMIPQITIKSERRVPLTSSSKKCEK